MTGGKCPGGMCPVGTCSGVGGVGGVGGGGCPVTIIHIWDLIEEK